MGTFQLFSLHLFLYKVISFTTLFKQTFECCSKMTNHLFIEEVKKISTFWGEGQDIPVPHPGPALIIYVSKYFT